jgi:thioredoxin reductase (NADPH)
MTDKRLVLTDEDMATNIPGVFAAGDCTGGLLQISKAVYEGAKAGTGAIDYIRNLPIRKTA